MNGSTLTVVGIGGAAIATSLASLPALSAGTANIGNVNGTTLTVVGIGGAAVATSLASLPALSAGSANIGNVNGSTVSVVGLNNTPIIVTPSTATLKSASFSITATGTLISGVAGKALRVYALAYISGGVASVNFRDGGTTNLEGAFAHAANSGRVENVNPPAFLFKTSAGNSLDMVYSGAGTVAGRVSYWEE